MSKEERLRRFDELKARLDILLECNAPERGWTRLSEGEIRYAVPERFKYLYDIDKAIMLVVNELRDCYGIDILDENKGESTEKATYIQLSLFDILLMSSVSEPLKAA